MKQQENGFFSFLKDEKTFTSEQNNYYFKLMANGDKKARDIIIENNLQLVLMRCGVRFRNTPYEACELISSGMEGLIKAVDGYKLESKVQFNTYASVCIDNEILYYMRKQSRHTYNQSLNQKLKVSDDNEVELGELIPSYDDNLNNVEDLNCIYYVLKILDSKIVNNRDKEMFLLYYGFYNNKCYNQYELSEMFGISQSRIARILKETLKKIRNEFDKDEIKIKKVI